MLKLGTALAVHQRHIGPFQDGNLIVRAADGKSFLFRLDAEAVIDVIHAVFVPDPAAPIERVNRGSSFLRGAAFQPVIGYLPTSLVRNRLVIFQSCAVRVFQRLEHFQHCDGLPCFLYGTSIAQTRQDCKYAFWMYYIQLCVEKSKAFALLFLTAINDSVTIVGRVDPVGIQRTAIPADEDPALTLFGGLTVDDFAEAVGGLIVNFQHFCVLLLFVSLLELHSLYTYQ